MDSKYLYSGLCMFVCVCVCILCLCVSVCVARLIKGSFSLFSVALCRIVCS